jgi:hypothetical protein
VDVSHQLQQVHVLLAKHRLVSILKDMPMTAMAAIELASIPCKQSPHDRGQGCGAGSQQKMNVIGQQGPGKASRMAAGKNLSEAIYEALTVALVPEYLPSLDSTNHDVLKSAWGIDAGLSRHAQDHRV